MNAKKYLTTSLVRVFMIIMLLFMFAPLNNSVQAAGNPDLRVSISHIENFDIGSLGTYSIIVDNQLGAGDAINQITVTITLPRGLTRENYSGPGWSCSGAPVNLGPDTVTCTTNEDVLAPPNLPQIATTLFLDVRVDTNEYTDGTFPSQLTTTAEVSVSGDPSNHIDTDLTLIDKSDLVITSVTFDPATPIGGQAFDILVTVKNNGQATSESVVYRDVFVNSNPATYVNSVGCYNDSVVSADWERGDLNDSIVAGGSDSKNVNTSTHGPSPTYGDSLPAGVYQIYVMVDSTCINIEASETNNIYGPVSLTVEAPYECGHVFGDVATAYWACSFIEILYSNGVTGGCSSSPLLYCPDDPVTRAQMAVFLEKGIHTSAFVPPNVSPTFLDTTGHWAQAWIEALKTDGITSGCLVGYYCPDSSTTRAQMAVFLLKSKYGASYSPPAPTGKFLDVATNYWAAAWIEKLAADGITSGCGSGNYCPENPVTRAQMAVFLVKTFSLVR